MQTGTGSDNSASSWRGLYLAGGAAALIAVVIFRRNCGAEFMGFSGFGIVDVPARHPSSPIEWFTMFQDDRLLGLILFDIVNVVNYALLGLIFLALYGALRRTNKSAMTITTTFGFVGIAVYIASNQALAMLTLSDQYAAARDEAQRMMLLAAGQALLVINNPGSIYQGTAIYMGLFLVTLAGLIISLVMLQSQVFNKWTAYVGILANGILLFHFIALALAPVLIVFPTVISAPFRVLWYVLIAIRLFRLGSGVSTADVQPGEQVQLPGKKYTW